jgi:hypothetical protein
VVRVLDSIEDLQECRDVARSAFERWMTTTGHRAGEFASSPALVAMAVELLRPIEGRIYDAATGAASMLLRSAAVAAKPVQLFGQERSEGSWRIGMLFLLLSGFEFDLRVGDSLQFDAFPDLKADRVVVDPPLGMRIDFDVAAGSEQRWTFAARRGSASEILWIQHCIHHLAEDGLGAVIVAPNFLFNSPDRKFREWLAKSGHLNAVIGLPGRIAYGTGIPLAMLLLSRQRSRPDGHVLFVDASEMETGSRRTGPTLESTEVQRVRDAVDQWTSGAAVDENGYSRSVPIDEIESQGFDLSPKRFISFLKETPTIEGEQLPERLERLKPATIGQLASAADSAADLVALLQSFKQGHVVTKEVRLGDLVVDGAVPGRPQIDSDQSPQIPWIPTSAVGSPLLEPPDASTGEDLGKRVVQRGDVLLGEIPSGAGRFSSSVVEFDGPAGFSRSLLRLRPNPAVVDGRFLSVFLSSQVGAAALMSITGGATIQRVRRAALSDLRIELPELDEQRRLADAFDQLQVERTKLEFATQALADLTETISEGLTAGSIDFETSGSVRHEPSNAAGGDHDHR